MGPVPLFLFIGERGKRENQVNLIFLSAMELFHCIKTLKLVTEKKNLNMLVTFPKFHLDYILITLFF